jgi:hypothetical protein
MNRLERIDRFLEVRRIATENGDRGIVREATFQLHRLGYQEPSPETVVVPDPEREVVPAVAPEKAVPTEAPERRRRRAPSGV